MPGVSLEQALLTSALTLLGILVIQIWQSHRDRLNDERVLRDRRAERVRQLLSDTITLIEEWHSLLSDRIDPHASSVNNNEDVKARYQASMRTYRKLHPSLLLDSATEEFADRLYEALFTFVGAFLSADATSMVDKPLEMWRYLQRAAARAQEVLSEIEQPLPRRRFLFQRKSQAASHVPPPYPLSGELRRFWVQDTDVEHKKPRP